MTFLLSNRQVFNSSWYDEKLSFVLVNVFISLPDLQAPFDDHEKLIIILILIFMLMPNELTLKLGKLYILSI